MSDNAPASRGHACLRPSLYPSSLVVAALIFLGFALGRLLSMQLDGKPNKLLLQGLVFEVVLGSLAATGIVMSLV